MNPDTVARLNRVSQRFYEHGAAAFAASRRGVWRGWRRVLELFLEHVPVRPRPGVLDVGCGNGRFVELLAERLGRPFDVLGLDASAPLLAAAGRRHTGPGTAEFLRLDLVADSLEAALGRRRFDLIVLFGLLHHVPGRAARARLLREAYGLLAPAGMLALSFWDFARTERLAGKIVPWRRLAETGGEEIEPAELEPGDFLLGFGAGERALRYCHFAAPEEREELVTALGLRRVGEFRSDGREGDLNHYFVGVLPA